jgi:hypothetical protein
MSISTTGTNGAPRCAARVSATRGRAASLQRRRRAASDVGDDVGQPRDGGGVPEVFRRQADLVAGVRAGGELQVPAVVTAAAATPERDPRASQPQVLGVEVHGRHGELCQFPRWPHTLLRDSRGRPRQCPDKIGVDRLA